MQPAFVPLVITTLAVVIIGIALPYTPMATPLGLERLPPTYFLFLGIVVGSYLVLVEIVKERGMIRLLSKAEN